MRKFAFPLEKVLEVRELKRLIAEERLGALLNEMYAIEHALEVIEERETKNRDDLLALVKQGFDSFQMKAILNYGAALNEDIRTTKEQLARQTLLVREAQEEAISRTTEKKALEQLKEKHRSQYMKAYWWEQNKELDEIGSRYYQRNGKEVT